MITLRSADLEVQVTPERGADIVQVIDLATGVAVFTQSPTGDVTSGTLVSPESMVHWLDGYPGGWQLLAPNAGPARTHEGVSQGFHGEASLARWEVLEQSATSLTLRTRLATAPLELQRVLSLDGGDLQVTDTITNGSPDPTSTRLVQHPAFGSPFLDEHSYLVTNARLLIADADAPGSMAEPNASGDPQSVLRAGPVPASVALPGPGSRESLFAAFSDFGSDSPSASVSFMSPTQGFGMRLTWDPTLYPNAWFWIEANASSGWPWFRRLYAIAVEPANVLPGEGTAPDGRERGGLGLRLEAGQTVVSTILLSRVSLPNPNTLS